MALCKLAVLIVSILDFRATAGFQLKILGHYGSAGLEVRATLGCLLLFNMIHLRVIQAVDSSNSSFFFIAEEYSVVST